MGIMQVYLPNHVAESDKYKQVPAGTLDYDRYWRRFISISGEATQRVAQIESSREWRQELF
ncbi:hypothetical protein J6590_021106 [Homalodisca vitripennis]|nr:hypothetical protein J6590_021106 [Homalodisca vitripennis]